VTPDKNVTIIKAQSGELKKPNEIIQVMTSTFDPFSFLIHLKRRLP